jgi:hypothetical protein
MDWIVAGATVLLAGSTILAAFVARRQPRLNVRKSRPKPAGEIQASAMIAISIVASGTAETASKISGDGAKRTAEIKIFL